MPEFIEFTTNYNDLSTERGFQWEFFCERCGNGYRSKFRPSATGLASEALDLASGLLGGLFGQVAEVGERVHSAAWERAHDAAFAEAIKEVRELFVQCPGCNAWVCRERCWNEARGLCLDCAPDATVTAASAQAQAIAEQVEEAVRERDYDVKKYVAGEHIRAACPKCGAPVKPQARFCSQCGAPLQKERFCSRCGSPIEPDAKFCPQCGAKQ